MSKIKIVISDLHLADSHSIFEGFGDLQQSALEGLLTATSTNSFADDTEAVELIINGDCFEFLFMEPYENQGITYPAHAQAKLERVIDGHRPFFDTLQHFITQKEGRLPLSLATMMSNLLSKMSRNAFLKLYAINQN